MLMKELIDQWKAKQQKRVELGKLKPASLATFASHVNTWIAPNLGQLEVEQIRNGVVKQFAETIATAGKSPKTIREIVALVKQILESHVNQDGEPILDLKWRNEFIFENIKEIGRQKQPTISKDKLNAIIRNHSVRPRDRVLLALAASTGLRVGELLAIVINGDTENTSWDSATAAIHVRKSVWRGQLQSPKTVSAVRTVDLSTPLNNLLLEFTRSREAGEFLFAGRSGRPLSQKFVEQSITTPNNVPGMHSLRRFRISHLREVGCNESILRFWLGHADSSVTDGYDKSRENVELRRTWAERCGTGLELSEATKACDPQPKPKPEHSKPTASAKPKLAPVPSLASANAKDHPSTVTSRRLIKKRRKPLMERIKLNEKNDAKSAAPHYQATESDLPAELFTPALTPAPITEADLARAKAELEALR